MPRGSSWTENRTFLYSMEPSEVQSEDDSTLNKTNPSRPEFYGDRGVVKERSTVWPLETA